MPVKKTDKEKSDKEKSERDLLIPVVNVKKSNSLIQSIGKTTLLANKVFLTALLKVEKRNGCPTKLKPYYDKLKSVSKVDFSKGLVAEFSNSDMRKFLPSKSGSFYKNIDELMDVNSPHSLKKQWGILIQNDEDGLYGFVDVITAMIYDRQNSKLFIKFSDEEQIQKEIYGLRKNYTILNYSLMMKFKSIYSYRIYEMILGRIGYEDGRTKVKRDKYYFTYGLSQLKYQLGVLDPYINADVRKALTEARTEEDFERIEKSLSDEHTMMRFSDFETYTLARAMKEINGLQDPDYIFDYEPTRSGRGGRITEVNFIITRVEKNTKTETEKFKLSEEEKDEILDRISDLIDEPLKLKDIRAIAETADYDFDKVKAAYEIAEESSADIENLVGFLKSAIKNGYEKPVSKKAKKSTFVDIDADEIDYDEIAKRKIDRQFKAV